MGIIRTLKIADVAEAIVRAEKRPTEVRASHQQVRMWEAELSEPLALGGYGYPLNPSFRLHIFGVPVTGADGERDAELVWAETIPQRAAAKAAA